MSAIRVRKRGKSAEANGLTTVHALRDDGTATLCGRPVADLDVAETLSFDAEIERLPGRDGCQGCQRTIDRVAPARPSQTLRRSRERGGSVGRAKLDDDAVWHDLV